MNLESDKRIGVVSWILGVVALVGIHGCSVNPATGERQLMLVSESEEVAIGRESNEAIVAELGLYDDAAVQAWVADLGKRLAASSERPDLPWTFQVVDDPLVNAFALPGGFIYVTRGILGHLESTAGMAGVLGHEIGHVTARHGASRMSRGLLAQIGLGVGSVVSPKLASVADIASSGIGLLFLKYGRDDERQADSLGFRYAERTGYDPRAMTEVFEMLERTSRRAEGSSSVPSWLSTHPAPDARRSRVEAAVAGRTDFGGLERGGDEFLRRIDGLIYGADPRQGFFQGDRFLHPSLAFELTLPKDWKHRNQRNAVISVQGEGQAAVIVTLAAQDSAAAAATAFRDADGVDEEGDWRSKIGGVDVESVVFRRSDGEESTRGVAVFVEQGGVVLRLLALATEEGFGGARGELQKALGSFRRVRDREVLGVEPLRVEVARLDRDRTPEQLAASYDAPVSAEQLAMLNGVDPGETLSGGSLVKKVVGRRPPQ